MEFPPWASAAPHATSLHQTAHAGTGVVPAEPRHSVRARAKKTTSPRGLPRALRALTMRYAPAPSRTRFACCYTLSGIPCGGRRGLRCRLGVLACGQLPPRPRLPPSPPRAGTGPTAAAASRHEYGCHPFGPRTGPWARGELLLRRCGQFREARSPPPCTCSPVGGSAPLLALEPLWRVSARRRRVRAAPLERVHQSPTVPPRASAPCRGPALTPVAPARVNQHV